MEDPSPGIAEEITDLRARIVAGDHIGAAGNLNDLRRRWNRTSSAFSPEHVEQLTELGAQVAGLQASAIERALSATFGFSGFRRGQREITEAVV
ncbi:MAG: hypothetical protein OEP52_03810, partial [Acidimicrobiia bacterium]|nr:hypothetical protein [Acidimicrobiia bacterium]